MISNSEFVERRKMFSDSMESLLNTRREAAASERRDFFCPDKRSVTSYEASLSKYRSALREMLGWPLTEPQAPAEITARELTTDDKGRILQVSLDAFGHPLTYGLLFLPAAEGHYPLVIAQHGGLGAPELAAGLVNNSPANYNELVRGLRSPNLAVFAPQLLVWGDGQEPAMDQHLLDRELRKLGGSRAAFDLQMLHWFLDWLAAFPEIDSDRIGMAGLSYGGFYTLFFAALEPRIRVAVSSCFVNDRYRNSLADLAWTGIANRFLDSEVAAMVCPRPLFLEAGEKDELFNFNGFPPVAAEIAATYESLGLSSRFSSRVHSGGHEYDPDRKAQEFLLRWL